MRIKWLICKILQNHVDFQLFFLLLPRRTTGSRIPGPRRDRCVAEFVVHRSLLIKDFSVYSNLNHSIWFDDDDSV